MSASEAVPAPAGSSSTREKLLDAAARLFAERGVFEVSLAEIVRAAGQRNSSAIHYHFGNRDQILVALLEPHVRVIERRRRELLAVARATEATDLRPVVEALVRPVTELAERGWRERAYLRIGLDVADHAERVAPEVRSLLRQTAGREAFELLAARAAPMPPEVTAARAALCVGLVGRAAAERAGAVGRRGRIPRLDDEAFVANLVDMVLGAFTHPVTVPPAAPAAADA